MLRRIAVYILLSCIIHAAENPTCIDWGIFSKKVKHKEHVITYASGRFSYIIEASHKTDTTALSIAHGRIHLLCAYHLPQHAPIKNTAEFVALWKPIEMFMREYTPNLQIALAYYEKGRLVSVIRGHCGLYHCHNDRYAPTIYAEASQATLRSFKEKEYVSICGVSCYEQGDNLFLFSSYLDDRSCPDTTLTWIEEELEEYSATTKAYLTTLHMYAPRIRLVTERNRTLAENRIQENCACIVVKNKKI